jgi:hypothetical protein
MRVLIAVVLAIVAIGAAGIWALGQFGHMFSGGQAEARAPLVREPELVAATDTAPAASAAPNETYTLQSEPEPKAAAPATAAPAPAESAEVAPPPPPPPPPPAPDAAASARLRADSLEAPALRSAPAPAESPAALAEAPPPAAAADPLAAPASAPTAAATSATAGVTPSLASQFKSRKVTYNRPPAKLGLNKAIDVSLVINATDDANAGQEALQGFPGTVVERDVDLSDTVSAQLTGVGFDITSQTVQRQKLSGKTINRWQWRVTPTEIGTRTLILEIFGYATGSLDAEPLDAYRDEITVEVQQFDQIVGWAKSVQPVFAVLAALAGAASALFAFLRFREERKSQRPNPSA